MCQDRQHGLMRSRSWVNMAARVRTSVDGSLEPGEKQHFVVKNGLKMAISVDFDNFELSRFLEER